MSRSFSSGHCIYHGHFMGRDCKRCARAGTWRGKLADLLEALSDWIR